MHLKVFVKLKKTLKIPLSGQKNPKKPKKPKKTQKNPKKTHWAGFFLKKPGFFPTLIMYLMLTLIWILALALSVVPVTG